MFRGVQTVCPDGPLESERIFAQLRAGACAIRWGVFEPRAGEAVEVRLPSGRVELQLDGGTRLLELRNPPRDPPLYSQP
jgi:hypothetical protein